MNESFEAAYDSLAHSLALAKQRITALENRLSHLEAVLKVLEPAVPCSGAAVYGYDGKAIAAISVMRGESGYIIMVSPLVDLLSGPPLNTFLVNYFEERKRDGLISEWHVRRSGEVVRHIRVEIASDADVAPFTVKEAIGKIRWTLQKMYANSKEAAPTRPREEVGICQP